MEHPVGFDWYGDLPNGIELLVSRKDESRRSASWFLHRLPGRTDTMFDLSSDPVVSLEIDASGAIDRAVDGKWQRADLHSDTVTLTPAQAGCEWRWEGQPLKILDVYLPFELLQAAWSDHFRGDFRGVNLIPTLRLEEPGIVFMMKSILASAKTGHSHAGLLYESWTQHLIVYLLGLYGDATASRAPSRGALSPTVLRKVQSFIDDHLAVDVSLTQLAGIAGLSRFHFLRQFRASVGETPHTYLVRRRLMRARDMLMSSKLPMGDIAAHCGFADPS